MQIARVADHKQRGSGGLNERHGPADNNKFQDSEDTMRTTLEQPWLARLRRAASPRRMSLWALALLTATATLAPGLGHAQSKALPLATITTGFAPGGSSDVVARLVADYLRGRYAENVIVESKVGAGGRIALEHVKNGLPDGSHLLVSPSGMFVLFPHIYDDLRYDSLRDFAPVTRLAKFPFFLVISEVVPPEVKTLDDFIAWCKENPGKASFGSPGAGTSAHFSGIMLGQKGQFPFTHVAYRGMAPLVTDLMGGHIAAGVLTPADILPLLETGKLRLLASTGTERSRFAPDVPTYTELGYPDIVIEESYSLYAPNSIPEERKVELARLANEAIREPNVQTRFESRGLEPAGTTPDELQSLIQNLHQRWGDIVKSTGFKPTL